MQRLAMLALLVLAGVTGCTGYTPPPDIGYLPPAGPTTTSRSALVQQPSFLVWGNLVDRLQQQSGIVVTHADEDAGYIVARYSGDPEPYVNCGWIVSYKTGNIQQISAAQGSTTFTKGSRYGPVDVDRNLRLDGRMVVLVQPNGDSSIVRANAFYVLSKLIDTRKRGRDRIQGQQVEVISFGSGGRGSFAKGTVCQPTGGFERLVMESLPQTSVAGAPPPSTIRTTDLESPPLPSPADIAPAAGPAAAAVAGLVAPTVDQGALAAPVGAAVSDLACASVEPIIEGDNRVRLTGYVATEEDATRAQQAVAQVRGVSDVSSDLDVLPWPFCEFLQVTTPYRPQEEGGAGLDVTIADGKDLLRAGDPLTLDLAVPLEANYLYLGYVQNDGKIGHIATLPARDWEGSDGRIRYRTGFQIAEPFGREMILAVASERPLFTDARPAYESADPYLADLRQRLDELATGGGTVLVDQLFITTLPDSTT